MTGKLKKVVVSLLIACFMISFAAPIGVLATGSHENYFDGEGKYHVWSSEHSCSDPENHHEHTDACYVSETELFCGYEEEHQHSDACYTECTQETNPSHWEQGKWDWYPQHISGTDCQWNGSWTNSAYYYLSCGYAYEHTHDASCYVSSDPLCGKTECTADCYSWEETLYDYYTVTFNPNNGENAVDVKVVPGVDEYSLTVPSFTGSDDTRITGWYLEPECTTAVDPSTITTDSTVYAKWETVTKHTVTFIGLSGNKGFGTISTQQVADGECAASFTPSSRRGYTFDGWYSTGMYTKWDFDTPITEDITLSAGWQRTSNSVDHVDIVFHTGSIYYTVDGHEVNTTAQVSNVSVTINGQAYRMDANTSIDGNSGYEEYGHSRNNNITITQTSPIKVSCNLTLNLTPGSAEFNELKAILDKSGASYSVNSAGKLVVPYTGTFTYAQHFYLNMCKSSGFDIQIAGGILGSFITNGSLEVKKEVTSGSNGTFSFKITDASGNTVEDNDGKTVSNFTITTTNKTGSKIITNLPVGTYYVTEMPSVGYVVSDGQDYKQATITAASKYATVTFYNKEVSSSNYGYLTLSKTISGAPGKLFLFNIYNEEGNIVYPNVQMDTTGGQATRALELPTGTYYIEEVSNSTEIDGHYFNGATVTGAVLVNDGPNAGRYMATVTKGTEVQVSFANTYSADKTYTVEYYFETGHGTGVYNMDSSKTLTNQPISYGQTKTVADHQQSFAGYTYNSTKTTEIGAAAIAYADAPGTLKLYYSYNQPAAKTYTVEYYFETGHGTGVYNMDSSKTLTNQPISYGQTKTVADHQQSFAGYTYNSAKTTDVGATEITYATAPGTLKLYYSANIPAAKTYTVEYYFETSYNSGEYTINGDMTLTNLSIAWGETKRAGDHLLNEVPDGFHYDSSKTAGEGCYQLAFANAPGVIKLYYSANEPAAKTYTVEYYFETSYNSGVYNIDNSKTLTNQPISYGQTKSVTDHPLSNVPANFSYNAAKTTGAENEEHISITFDAAPGILKLYYSANEPAARTYTVQYYFENAYQSGVYTINNEKTLPNQAISYGQTKDVDDHLLNPVPSGYTYNSDKTAEVGKTSVTFATAPDVIQIYYSANEPAAKTYTVEYYFQDEYGVDTYTVNSSLTLNNQAISYGQTKYAADHLLSPVLDGYYYDATKTAAIDMDELSFANAPGTIKLYYSANVPDAKTYTVEYYLETAYNSGVYNIDNGRTLENQPISWGETKTVADHQQAISNYTYNAAYTANAGYASVSFDSNELVLKLYYDKNRSTSGTVYYEITINYLDLATSENIIDSYNSGNLRSGTYYDVADRTEIEIDGYTWDSRDSEALTGYINSDIVINVYYTQDEDIDDPNPPLNPDPDDPDPTPDPEPTPDPGDGDVDIDDPSTPLGPKPDNSNNNNSKGDVEIEDEDVPLSNAPKTSDDTNIALLAAALGLSATGLITLLFTGREKKEEEPGDK